MTNANGEFITIKEAAWLLKVHPNTLRRQLKRNKKNPPPVYRIFNRIRFRRNELIEWVTQQRK